ncbi:protein RETICULATA, chloroplastic-like [Mercurialis annua]|uniref:protein RETICULATA, chloroplastic-like n=1 Tax=Mercurialis annua TaxID=3986 RepID=UPI002160AA8E|nr:protein RETICULATA, chloroplastic-like [Mercurialis annua]
MVSYAAASSSLGLSNAVNFQNDAVLFSRSSIRFKSTAMCSFQNPNSVKKQQNHRLVMIRCSQFTSPAEPQSDAVTTTGTLAKNEGSAISAVVKDDVRNLGSSNELDNEFSGSDGNGGNGSSGGGGNGGGGGDNEGDDFEEKEFGPILKFEQVMKEAESRGVSLPFDMVEAAKSVGIREVILLRYLELQGSGGILGFLMKSCSMLRNRMLADPSFLFKIGTEIVIDSCCATFAEVQKRGKDFWAEFELYVADLLVGVVVNVALVGMLAPYVRIGRPSVSKGFIGWAQHAYGALPSSVFEAERPGCRFTLNQRIATYFYKGVLYGSVGFGCGIVGQGIANLIMTAKRSIKKSEDDIPVPPLLKSAALWGVFLAVSSNIRYQIINGLERVVEASPVAKQVPPVAMAFTVGVRFANNVYGGMQFVDWARWSGVQ